MYLDAQTIEVLREHRKRQRKERVALGPAWDAESDLVFRDELGDMIHPDWFSRHFDSVVRSLHVPRIRLHDLRHTYATLALNLRQACIPKSCQSDWVAPRSASCLSSTPTSFRQSLAMPQTSSQAESTISGDPQLGGVACAGAGAGGLFDQSAFRRHAEVCRYVERDP